MKILILLFLPLSFLSQQVLSSGGNAPIQDNNNPKNTISFTIGEPLITTSNYDNEEEKIITQGFQQPIEEGRVYDSGVNAFSPNRDGNNDTWQFKRQSEAYEIEIFSRWGNIVWNNKEDIAISEWDGLDMNDKEVPDGTYFYTVTFEGKVLDGGTGYIEVTR